MQRGREPFAVAQGAGDDQRMLRALERRGKGRDLGLIRQQAAGCHRLRRRRLRGWDLPRRRDEGLAEWKVQVDGPGGRLGHRASSQAPPQSGRVRQLDGDARVEEPPGRAPVEVLLVDRLVRPHSLQLGRPVRREHDHRRPRVGRLDHGGVKLSRRRARRRQDDRGLARRLAEADSKERPASLVDMDENLDARMPLKRHRDRSRARARRDTRKLHALRGQLVDERGGEGLSYIHRIEW